jgi:hypothetical protein
LGHSSFVREEVALGPATSEMDKLVLHIINENLVDEMVKLWPFVHKSVTVRPFLFQILGRSDAKAHRPDVVCMSFMNVDHDYIMSRFDFFQESE